MRLSTACSCLSPSCVTVILHMLGTVLPNMCIKSRKYQSYRAGADELLHITQRLSARCRCPAQEEEAAESHFCTTCLFDQSKKQTKVWLKCWDWLSPLCAADLREGWRASSCCQPQTSFSPKPSLLGSLWKRCLRSLPSELLP